MRISCVQDLLRPEGASDFLELITDGHKPLCRCRDLNLGSPQKQHVLLPTEPIIQAQGLNS